MPSPTPWRLAVVAIAAALFAPRAAWAYPWMIKHGYANCAQCHVDPSGGGVLTSYGRAQAQILVATQYSKAAADETPGKGKDFAFGVVKLPEPLSLQADLRDLVIPDPANPEVILMQADLRGALQLGPTENPGLFTASGSIGTVSQGAEATWLTQNTKDPGWNLVSREYWAGVMPTKGLLIRAGRMNLPFGIRTEDHILYMRDATRTNGNDQQQTGLAISYTSKKWRGEVMGILGNLQVHPTDYWEHGYSLYGSHAFTKKLEVGVSSKLTVAQADVDTYEPRTFQAHGVYTRISPVGPLAILAEADLLLDNQNGTASTGLASTGILDYEPVQGVHVLGIGQYCDPDFADPASPAWTGGGAVQWFFWSHADMRVDAFDGVLSCVAGVKPTPMGLLQAHFML